MLKKQDIWSWPFWKRALERALRTFCQTLLGCIVVGTAVQDVDWLGAAAVGATAAICSILTSIVLGIPEHDDGDGGDGDDTPTGGIGRDMVIAVLLGLAVGVACMTGTPTAAQARTENGDYEGIDVSHWDAGLDIGEFGDGWLDYVIVKCGGDEDAVGGQYRDGQFDNFYNQAVNNGLHVGAYYYTDVRSVDEAIADANHAADILDDYDLDMPVYGDFEDWRQLEYLTPSELTQVMRAFCETIEARGYRAGIYTSGSWWQTVDAQELESFADWCAWWGRGTSDWPDIGIDYGMWQVGGIGWGHDVVVDPDSGDFHDYDLCRVAYWDDSPTPKPDPKPEPEPQPEPAGKLDVDGYGGTATVGELQSQLGTPVDNWITGQWSGNADYAWAIWAQEYDEGGSACVEALQRVVGAEPDGYWGYNTSQAVQKWLDMHGYSVGASGVDGYFGHDSVRALQRALNDGAFAGAEPAPEPEPEPTPRPEGQGTVEDVMDAAYGELGYYAPDDPLPGSKYGRWLADLTGEDWLAGPSWEIWWCMMYVSWCEDQGGVQVDGLPTYNTDIFYNGGGWEYEVDAYDVERGDIVIFDWNWDGATDHVALATGSYDGYGFPTIEGNVGNACVEYYRDMGNVAHVLRPDYA